MTVALSRTTGARERVFSGGAETREAESRIVKEQARQKVRCRLIRDDDLTNVVELLTSGFDRKREYWVNAIRRLTEHNTPPGLPKYGHVLECDAALVGVLLLIFSAREIDGVTHLRCNGSSLYVEPPFRGYAALLVNHSLRPENVTYFNITAVRHTWPMLDAQGYKRFANGIFVCVPALGRSGPLNIQLADAATVECGDLQPFEKEVLLTHAGYGCLSLICEAEGRTYPFVFGLHSKYVLSRAHLVYCRDQDDFLRFSVPLGRFLAWRGYFFVVLDANGWVNGLHGGYLAIRPKYAKGPDQLRCGDLPYSERVMFGF